MTALDQYQRLETMGLWHASPRDQRREVIVSMGDATLTISDGNMRALSHWSLPAVVRLNPGDMPALFGPAEDAPEVLELDDETMIRAIEKVRSAIERSRPRPGRLRNAIIAGAAALVLGATVFWLPGALIRRAVAVVPPAKRTALGDEILRDIGRIAGTPCATVYGNRALDRLHARLLPDVRGKIVVVPEGVQQAAHLPGGIILVNRELVEDFDDPAVLAGFVLAEDQAARDADPLRDMLAEAGIISTVRLMATGDLPSQVLDTHAENLLTRAAARPTLAEMITRFLDAAVPSTPYAYALDLTGESTLPLIEADPVPPGEARQILADSDWVALQGICGS
jgi:hypothetical protein